ncbi:ComEA family DNA-binding protein [Thermosulfuriphilus sp.]
MKKLQVLGIVFFLIVFLLTGVWAAGTNINKATVSELDLLPGIGPKTAQAIVDYRQVHGPFKSVDDLLKVKGIGAKKLEKIRPLISVED